jgi:hypothetical protein
MASPFPFVAGNTLTAAQLNSIGEAWTSYTPTVSQGVAVTCTVSYAKWAQVNKIVLVQVQLVLTGAGTGGSVIAVSLPNTPSVNSVFSVSGSAMFLDESAAKVYNLLPVLTGAPRVVSFWDVAANGNFFGATPNVASANTDKLNFAIAYEVA